MNGWGRFKLSQLWRVQPDEIPRGYAARGCKNLNRPHPQLVALVLLVSGVAVAEPSPRVAYVERVLTAVRGLGATGRTQLDHDLYEATRTKCHADSAPPSATCLIEVTRTLCKDPTCELAGDVIATNLRSVDDFVDEHTRVRLLRANADYHAALAAELRKRYAMLAAELALAGGANEAGSIDRMCAERDRAIHACAAGDRACIPSLPWSRCVAALVWFIGGQP